MVKHLLDFGTDRRGGVAVSFALALVPMIGLGGAALDYARATATRAQLQSAVDSTALMLAHKAPKMSQSELQALAGPYAQAMIGTGARIGEIQVTKRDKTVDVTLSGVVPARFLPVAGIDNVNVSVKGTSAYGIKKIELALVLDNTGSMLSLNKLTELKKASLSLLKTLESVVVEPGSVKVSVVPFATQVNVGLDNRDATWLDFNHPGVPVALRTTKANWTGCVSDRNNPNDTTDAPAGPAQATLYPAAKCQYGVLQPVMPLTDNFLALRGVIGGMVANGNTNITIGIAHGMATLSPGLPYGGAAPFGTPDVSKFMVVLTDGDNTENRDTRNGATINVRTQLACQQAKDPSYGITVYTIRVINGNAALLRNCASDPSKYKDVTAAAELDAVFKAIADEITSIRLTN